MPAIVRITRKLLAVTDKMQALTAERGQVSGELEFHRHINEDAQRDATVSGSNEDRLEATSTAADVRRFERRLAEIDRDLAKLERKRQSLIAKLD